MNPETWACWAKKVRCDREQTAHLQTALLRVGAARAKIRTAQLGSIRSRGSAKTRDAYLQYMAASFTGADPFCYAIVEKATGRAVGVASYMRIVPEHGCIEVGHINFSPALQRTPIATEAMYLMMRHVFELGYRRYEWKCDSLNAPSRAAAQRLGFSFEGVFRKAIVYKGRNRDTAWYSVTNDEWPAVRGAFEQWLEPGNFDAHGAQRVQLRWLTTPLLRSRG